MREQSLLHILSLGAGVQSTVMALMAARGEITPMPDAAIFADTGWEPKAVYEHLWWLCSVLPFPVHVVSKGNIQTDLIASMSSAKKFASIPYFTADGGMGRRQCTKEYKLYPIRDKAKELLGWPPGKRIPKGTIRMWIGISTDEATRVKPSSVGYIENIWPLIDAGMSRHSCLEWFSERYPARVLAKSACIGCPYHNDALWRDMKLNDPESFADAVETDAGMRQGMRQAEYMHRSLKPLGEVDFRNLEDHGQLNMFNNECEGMCGV